MTSEQQNFDSRIESRQEVGTYLARLEHALKTGSAKISFQKNRRVDKNVPNRSDMRIFGKVYSKGEVYIKIRVELMKATKYGVEDLIFIMSFHYSTKSFEKIEFPYS